MRGNDHLPKRILQHHLENVTKAVDWNKSKKQKKKEKYLTFAKKKRSFCHILSPKAISKKEKKKEHKW